MIRIGVIGAGRNASGHVKAFARETERCELVAVADPVAEAAENLAREYGMQPHADFTAFLDAVDAVVISSPGWLHADQARVCLEAGKHVWCEKPVALQRADMLGLATAARAAPGKTFVGFSVRFSGLQQRLEQMVIKGDIGQPLSAWSRRFHYMDPEARAPWRQSFAQSGGVLHEILSHEVDWIAHLWPEVTDVTGFTWSPFDDDSKANDHLAMTMRFANGAIGQVEGSYLSPMPEFYRGVVGTEGALFTNKWGSELYWQPKGAGEPEQLTVDAKFDKHQHFLDVVDGDVASEASLAWGLHVALLCDTALESAVQKTTLPYDRPFPL